MEGINLCAKICATLICYCIGFYAVLSNEK